MLSDQELGKMREIERRLIQICAHPSAGKGLHREVRRRARVVSIFPNPASCLRLVSAVLAEISDEWLIGRTYLTFQGSE